MQTYEWERGDASCLEECKNEAAGKANIVMETEIEGGDFSHAGQGASDLKGRMKKLGIPHETVKRTAVSAYEAEMNVVIHTLRGTMRSTITSNRVKVTVKDEGQGISDIEKALKPGYSTATEEVREMGFGAGLGFTNIRRNADRLLIKTKDGEGTEIEIIVCLDHRP
ncbi:MAG: ATP-binding protein [Candidatus Bipolaricaulota bacterium]